MSLPPRSAHLPPLDPRVAELPTLTLLEGLGPQVRPLRFRPIPAGSFLMGSRHGDPDEQPQQKVIVPRLLGHGPGGKNDLSGVAFWMAEVPVTQGQFDLWKADPGPSGYAACFQEWSKRLGTERRHEHSFNDPKRFPRHYDHPAENIDFREGLAFAEWLSALPAVKPAIEAFVWEHAASSTLQIQLPSETLWEYACRAGTRTEYWSGDGEEALAQAGVYYRVNEQNKTEPVAGLPPNPWGLFDMHGNVREWCSDPIEEEDFRHRPSGAPLVVPQADWRTADRSAPRVVRGGSWLIAPGWCRSANRNGSDHRFRIPDLGFRLCLLPGPEDIHAAQPIQKPSAGAKRGREGGLKPTEQPPNSPGADGDGKTRGSAKRGSGGRAKGP
jgi:formylglycine-generating enzyme required for sulfatase activity